MQVKALGRIRDASGNYGVMVTYPNGQVIRLILPDMAEDRFKDLPSTFVIDLVKEYESKIYN